jgi:pimeloyl-ACP methyl ester carboxylesterase
MQEFADKRLTRPDGRMVAWSEAGSERGRPVLRITGTPGSRLSLRSDMSPWLERDLRMITPERPGFGVSTRLPGRGFVEHADDLAAILDELGIDRVAIYGASGAAPHILAFVARHPDRVVAATILVGAAPLEEAEAEQMIEINVETRRLTLIGDVAGVRAVLVAARDDVLADPLAGFISMMHTAPPSDQEIMGDPAWQVAFARGITEALRPGVDGWLDEGLAIDRNWSDFDPREATRSITWWHSDGDRNCPLSAAQRLVGLLPDARLHVWSEAGHLTPYRKEAEILDELLSRC